MKKSELRKIIREEIQRLNEDSIDDFLWDFKDNYPHIQPNLSKQKVKRWLNKPHIKKLSQEKKMDLFSDYIVSQGLGNIQESKEHQMKKSELRKIIKEELLKETAKDALKAYGNDPLYKDVLDAKTKKEFNKRLDTLKKIRGPKAVINLKQLYLKK